MLETISHFTLGATSDLAAPELFPTELGSPTKDSFVFTTYAGALSSPPGGSGTFDMYRAERTDGGWATVDHLSVPAGFYRGWPFLGGVSPDHAYAFEDEGSEGSYLRGSSGNLELIGKGSKGTEPDAQGRYVSEGGNHIIFTTGDLPGQSAWCSGCQVLQLEEEAPPTGTGAIYDRSAGGPTHVVSLLPGNDPLTAGQVALYEGVSRDGKAVAFTVDGTLYVRVNNTKSEEVASGDPVFAGLSDNGNYLFYVIGETIHRFDTTSEEDVEINPSGEGEIVNIAADGSHVYFISEQQLDGGNGTLGEPNMYVWSGGAPTFVATVLPSDLTKTSGPTSSAGRPNLTNWTDGVFNPPPGTEAGPGADSSRTTPDGSVLVFESRAQLTAYDNAGHTEIYRYEVGADGPECLSCNPLHQPARGDARLEEVSLIGTPTVIHNLSDNGRLVFFETSESLVAGDENEVLNGGVLEGNDVYRWSGNDASQPRALISSGKSLEYGLPKGWESPFAPRANLLFSVTPTGSDVFFAAKEALVSGAGENGTQGIYDARIDGGFPTSPLPIPCVEEGCRPGGSGVAPAAPPAPSERLAGSGNVRAQKHHHSCRRQAQHKRRRCGHRKAGARRATSSTASPAPATKAINDSQPSATSEADRASPDSSETAAAGPVQTAAGGGSDFEIERFEAQLSTAEAAGHPDFETTIYFSHFNEEGDPKRETASASVENLAVNLPPGFLGNPRAVPSCSMGDFMSFGNCSADTQIGITDVKAGTPLYTRSIEPVFNITPPHPNDEVARFGFIAYLYPVFIDVKVRTASDYGVTALVHTAPGLGPVVRAKTTFWGSPSSDIHSKERLTPHEAIDCKGTACKAENGERKSTIAPADRKAFLSNSAACEDGQVGLEVTTYQLPGQTFTAAAPLAPITGCTGIPFAPSFSAEPTSHVAGAPTGLDTTLTIPQHLGEGERATATMREARVTLPEGMQVAAGAANWIGTCSDAQVGYHEEVDTACPDSAKLGTATIISPALSVPIEGTIYQRAPRPGHQLGLWLTADALGLHIKLPGELEPDKTTGRLTAVFSDIPQVPVEEIDLDIWGGPRAPLQNPDHCGTFATDFSFSPHSNDPTVTGKSTMHITEGCSQGFSPTLHAGVTEPVAGKFSPFVFDLTRPDGDQALRGFSLHLPDGELAKIKGVPLCSDTEAASAACPVGSRIGRVQATTGPGPDPFTIPEPGKAQPQIFLAGPYQGAPFSIVSEVPAQAGPFDLGVLAVRSALQVEPETGRAVVKADPLPQFFEGVGIAYRNLHAVIDRPEFNLNPTDCSETAVTADVTSTQGTVVHPSARFQVDGCKALKFKPKLSLRLKGGTKRAEYPALTAVLKARKGDANIAFASVALPHSEFIAQEHFGTICTRKQFAADKCPKKSIYGRAEAITPLLGKPLSGPVYLRSSNHVLPDVVAKLGGELEIDLVGRVDSFHGGLRTTFESVPDAPVTKFVLQMRGGAKGLFVNSTDICRGSHRATVSMKAQNGRVASLRPPLVSSGCGTKKLGKHKHNH